MDDGGDWIITKEALKVISKRQKNLIFDFIIDQIKDKFPCIKKYNIKGYKWWWRFCSLKNYDLKVNLFVKESELVMDSLINGDLIKIMEKTFDSNFIGCKTKIDIKYIKE